MTSRHSHNLSINSVLLLAEPTTPPAPGKLVLWESTKMNGHLALPLFNLDPDLSDKENRVPDKIDKEYLASISKVPLAALEPDILRLAKDQHGCRFLQKRIDENVVLSAHVRTANFEVIFRQVHPLLYELIIDPFGNYLVQKLIDYCSEHDLDAMLDSLKYNLFLISINQHGTRALQKVIDRMSNARQLSVLSAGLKPYIIELIKDLNGNHVIQKVLNKYPPEDCQFIYDSILDDLLVVATHKHGCCVLQKCLNHVNATQLVAFSAVILNYDVFTRLVNDQFGNYVLQYLVSIDLVDVNCRFFDDFLRFGINDLCNLKFSSNVIEKLMKSCYNNEYKLMAFSDLKFTVIAHILHSDINKLINDPYGNYVVQTLIDILINPNVSYWIELPTGDRALLPSLQLLVGDYLPATDSLQVHIIKKWFNNCKIVSSFGKRIQLKINIILNGASKSAQRKSLLSSHSYLHFGHNQSMNANGEFVRTDPHHHTRHLSLDIPSFSRLSISAPQYLQQNLRPARYGDHSDMGLAHYQLSNQNTMFNANLHVPPRGTNNVSYPVNYAVPKYSEYGGVDFLNAGAQNLNVQPEFKNGLLLNVRNDVRGHYGRHQRHLSQSAPYQHW